MAFVLSGIIASIAGVLYVYYNRFINPVAASFPVSVEAVLMAIVGGSGTILGPFLGSGIILVLRNWVSGFFHYYTAVLGVVFIVTVLWAPQGIMGLVGALARGKPRRRRMSEPAIRVERLSKVFGGLRAVDEASLSVASGERRVLIGPNGAGKTTLFNCIAGTLHATSGRVLLFGTDITALAENRRTALGMGRTFQISNVFTDLTVFENLMLSIIGTEPAQMDHAPAGRRRSRPSARRRSTGLAKVGLGERADEPVKLLSYGERRQLELALALNVAPEGAAARRAVRRPLAERAAALLAADRRAAARHHADHDRARHRHRAGARRPRHRAAPRQDHPRRHAERSADQRAGAGGVFWPRLTLAVRDIHTYYGDSYVLHGLSLEVRAGEIVAILGRNGMGKTTLIRSVAGLTPPRRGDVLFRGASLAGKPPYAISQAGIAIVPQGRRIFRSLSVRENLLLPTSALAPRAHTLDPGRKHWTLDAVLREFPQLAERLDNAGGSLSGGEQQMLAIGRALMANPSVILMDEPSEGLSPKLVQRVEEIMRRLRESGHAILLVEQNLALALVGRRPHPRRFRPAASCSTARRTN